MRKRALLTIAIGLAFPLTACIVACHSADSKSDGGLGAAPFAKVATAQRGDISHVLTLAGQFQPYQVVDVHPKVSGYMSRINVDIGDIVHQGQTLAVLEVPELKASYRALRSNCSRPRMKSRGRSTRSIGQRRSTQLCMQHLKG